MARDAAPPIHVRPFRTEDGAALRELTIHMDVKARVRLGVDRSEDFQAFNRVRYEKADTWVAEQDGRLVGFLDLGFSRYRVGDLTILGMYAGLAGVRAGYRGTPIFARLAAAGVGSAMDGGAQMGLSIANTQNLSIPRLLQRRFPRSVRGSSIHARAILLGPPYPLTHRYEIRTATEDDLPDLSDLIQRVRSRYVVSHTLLPTDYRKLPGLRLDDFLLVRRHGRVVACLALWDQDAIRRVVVCGYGRQERLLRTALLRAQGLTGVAPLPRPGEPLRLLHTVFCAAEEGQEHVWGALLRHACRRARGHGHHLLVVGLPETSPLLRTYRGLPGFTNENVTLLLGWDERVDAALHSVPVPGIRHEYALV